MQKNSCKNFVKKAEQRNTQDRLAWTGPALGSAWLGTFTSATWPRL